MSFGPTVEIQRRETCGDSFVPEVNQEQQQEVEVRSRSKKHRQHKKKKKDVQMDPSKMCLFCHKALKKCHCKTGKQHRDMFSKLGIPLMGGKKKNKDKRHKKHKKKKEKVEMEIQSSARQVNDGLPTTQI